jgi:hypothetical protein
MGTDGSGDTVKTVLTGPPSVTGTRRTSTGRPLAVSVNSSGCVPKPVETADTCTSTVESASRGSPADMPTTSRSRVVFGDPMPTVKTGTGRSAGTAADEVSPPSETTMMPPSGRPR